MPVAFKTALGSSSPNVTSSSSWTITTTAAIAVGDLVVVRAAADNLSATTPTFTCADSGGNSYTTHRQAAANATAAAGVAGAIMCSKATVAVASGGTITITLSGAVVAKTAYAESFTGVDNTTRSTPVSATAASGTALASPASGTVNAGDLVLGASAIESRGAVTGDADTTNGSWSARELALASASGTDTARVEVSGQYKIPNASGAQTFNQTVISTDWVAMLVVLQATPDPAVTQASYRFYDQGTESGSTALGAQDTAINGDLSFGDGIGVLRVRLQLTTAVATPATDDWQLQWDKNSSGSWTNVVSGSGAVRGYNDSNLTEGQATTNRLGAGTGSFVAGKVSEDGVVDDLGWTASNYTELLFAVQIMKVSFVEGDTIRFRVLRNGATATMTYTVTPLINVVSIDNAATISSDWNPVTPGVPSLTQKTWGGNNSAPATFTTASFTPTVGKRLLIFCSGLQNGGTSDWVGAGANLNDSLGTHLTYTFVEKSAVAANYGQQLGCWVSSPVISATAMTISIANGGGTSQAIWAVYEIDNYGGTGATGRFKDISGFFDTAFSLTLSAAPAATSLVVGFAAVDGDTSGTIGMTPGADFTELDEQGGGAYVTYYEAQTRSGSTSTTVGWQDSRSGTMTCYGLGAVGVELIGGAGTSPWAATAVGTVTAGSGATDWPGTIASNWGSWTATAIAALNKVATAASNWSTLVGSGSGIPDFLETFTQSDGTLALGWTTPGGTPNAIRVVSGMADNSAVGANSDAYKAAHGVNVSGDVEINLDFVLNGGTGSIGVRLALLNMGTGNGNGVLISGDGAGGGVVHVQRWVAGATVGYFTNYPHNINDTGIHHARVTYTAATGQWDIWIDGGYLGSGNDSSTQPNGPGIFLNFNGASSCKMDNLAINSYIGSTPPTVVATTNNGGNVTTVNKPAGGAVGDHYVLHVIDQDRTSSDPGLAVTGFTSTGAAQGVNGTGGYWWEQTFIRAHTGSEGSTFAPSNLGGIWCYLTCHLVRGADPATLSLGTQGALSGAGSLVVPGVTPAASTALALIHATDYDGGTTVYTDPAGWTQITKGTFNAAWVWRKNVLAAATGNVTIARTSSNRAAGQMLALPPSGVAVYQGWNATATGTVSTPSGTDWPATIATNWGTWTGTSAAGVNHPATVATSWGTWTATATGVVGPIPTTFSNGTSASGSTVTLTKPAGSVAGDLLLLCFLVYDLDLIMSSMTGWTQILYEGEGAGTDDLYMTTYWADGAVSDLTVSMNGSSYVDWMMVRYVGAHATTPIDATAVGNSAASGTTATALGVTTTTANTNLCIFTGGYNSTEVLSAGYSGFTQRIVNDLVNYTHTKDQAAVGATGNFTATKAVGGTWLTQVIAVRSAGATGGPTNVTGTIASNWGSWTATSTALVDHPATVNVNWGTWAATAVGALNIKAVIDTPWGTWTATAVGAPSHPATISTAWGTWTATAVGAVDHPATIATNWGTWTGTSVAGVDHPATVATSWGTWTATATGATTTPVNRVATIATNWGSWTATADGVITAAGNQPGFIATNWGTWAATGIALVDHPATVNVNWGSWTATATGFLNIKGVVNVNWGTWTATSIALVDHPATVNVNWGSWTATAIGAVASGAVNHPATIASNWGTWAGTSIAAVDHPATIATNWGTWVATSIAGVDHPATVATSWGTWTATATGVASTPVNRVATIATNWGTWTATADGVITAAGNQPGFINVNWGTWTATAVGALNIKGVIASSWGTWAATATGVLDHRAIVNVNWGGWTATAVGAPEKVATISTNWGGWAATSIAGVSHPAIVATNWGTWTATATGNLNHVATISTSWGTWTATAVGALNIKSVIASSWGTWTATAIGARGHPAIIAMHWGTWTATANGFVGPTVGTVLNTADAVYLGITEVDRVYAGATLVWP